MAKKDKIVTHPLPYSAAHRPADYTEQITNAVKAVAAGEAHAEQQRLFFHWLTHVVCGTFDMSYRPGGDDGRRATDFAEGKRFVGMQVIGQTRLTTPDKGGENG